MALTKEITKGDVKYSAGNYKINMICIVSDDGVECGRESFSIDFKPGDDPTPAVKALKKAMQDYVDRVVAERELYHRAQLDAAVTWLNTTVTIP
jgi:hypothetical protein